MKIKAYGKGKRYPNICASLLFNIFSHWGDSKPYSSQINNQHLYIILAFSHWDSKPYSSQINNQHFYFILPTFRYPKVTQIFSYFMVFVIQRVIPTSPIYLKCAFFLAFMSGSFRFPSTVFRLS